jgi:hypothetical protein
VECAELVIAEESAIVAELEELAECGIAAELDP